MSESIVQTLLLNSDWLGAVTTALESLFQCEDSAGRTLSYYPAKTSPDTVPAVPLGAATGHQRAEIGAAPPLPLRRILYTAMRPPPG